MQDQTEMLHVRLLPQQKHALRILAAKDNLDISGYVRKILNENTEINELARSLASSSPDMYQTSTDEEPIHASTR